MTDWDVVVVGAGPAGSVTAGLLAERGRRVLLLERWTHPRPKPCGEFLNPGALAALERTGFASAVLRLDPPLLSGWELTTWSGVHVSAGFAHPGGTVPPHGLGVDRARLDQALALEAVRRGAVLEERQQVLRVRPGPDGVEIDVRSGARESVRRARLLIAADGLRSRIARQLGATRRRPRRARVSLTARVRGVGPASDRGWLRIGGTRTVGMAPVSLDPPLWNVTGVVDSEVEGRRLAADPEAFLGLLLEQAAFPWVEDPRVVAGPWASGPFDWPVRRRTGPRWALVGDAAGYFDPLTGQGIHQAVHSAELAAADAERSLARADGARPLHRYARRLARSLAGTRAVQRLVAAVVEGPRLGGQVLPRLAAHPASASALLTVTGDLAHPLTLLRPRVWSPLLNRSPVTLDGGRTC